MSEKLHNAGYPEVGAGGNTTKIPELPKVVVSQTGEVVLSNESGFLSRKSVQEKLALAGKRQEFNDDPMIQLCTRVEKIQEDLDKVGGVDNPKNEALVAKLRQAEDSFKKSFVRNFNVYDRLKAKNKPEDADRLAKFEKIIDAIGLSEKDMDNILVESEVSEKQSKVTEADKNTPPPIPVDSLDVQRRIEETQRQRGVEEAFDMINKAGSDNTVTRLRKPSSVVSGSRLNTRPSFAVAGNTPMPGSQRASFERTPKSVGMTEVEGDNEARLSYLVNEIRNNYNDLGIKINEDGEIPKGFLSRNTKKVEKYRTTEIDLDNKLKEIEKLRHSLVYDRGTGSQDKWSKAYEEVKGEDSASVAETNRIADKQQQQKVFATARNLGYTPDNARGPQTFARTKREKDITADYDKVRVMSDKDVQADNAVDEMIEQAGVDRQITKAGFDEASVNKKIAKKEKKGFFARLFGTN